MRVEVIPKCHEVFTSNYIISEDYLLKRMCLTFGPGRPDRSTVIFDLFACISIKSIFLPLQLNTFILICHFVSLLLCGRVSILGWCIVCGKLSVSIDTCVCACACVCVCVCAAMRFQRPTLLRAMKSRQQQAVYVPRSPCRSLDDVCGGVFYI